MITGSDRWYVIGTYLETSTYTGLTTKPARHGLVPGEIAWDECDCDGLLAVTLPRVYLSELFPEETETVIGGKCQAPYEVGEFTVSIVRCAPGADPPAVAPLASELDIAAGVLMQDIAETMDALSRALCLYQDSDMISDYLITPAESAGPEGKCVGFTLRVRISLERI